MTLRIGHLSTFYHTAILLMAEGLVPKRLGVDVEWRLFGTGPAIVNAFERGELDLAYLGLPPAIIGMARGVPIVCVAGGHIEGTVIAGKREMRSYPEERSLEAILSQLKGERIGTPSKGSIHDVIIRKQLERFGLSEEVEIVNFPWADEITEAMVKGAVSAGVGTPSLAASIMRFAGGKVLYPASILWPHNPSYGIIVDREFLRKERALVEGYLILHEDATSWVRNSPRKAAKAISDFVGFIDEALVMETFRISPKYCAQLTEDYIASTMELVTVLHNLGYIDRVIASGEIFDISLIRSIHPEDDHYGDGITEARSEPA